MTIKVKFWGVRGSIATPGASYVQFGGNTSCVEMSFGGQRVILDAGTGIRNFGHWFLRRNLRTAHILLSHTHWDHIVGFPFFSPAYRDGLTFTVMAGHLAKSGGIRRVLSSQMAEPTFPVPIEIMKARLEFEDFTAGDMFNIGHGIRVRTAPLNHPDGATGYRLEYHGKALCYLTDTEHIPGKPDQNILGLIEGADVLIYDSTYTEKEFPARVGWGHSTWEEGMRLCRAANVKSLAIYHHDPDHDDLFMEQLEAESRDAWSGNIVARENMRLNYDR